MYKLTSDFLQEVLHKDGKAMVSVQRQALKNDIQEKHDNEGGKVCFLGKKICYQRYLRYLFMG